MSDQKNDSPIKEVPDDSIGRTEFRKLIHDLRNGLSPILMQAQLMAHYANNPVTEEDAIKELAVAIEQSVKAMAQMLEEK